VIYIYFNDGIGDVPLSVPYLAIDRGRAMKFIKLSNEVIINLEAIATITKPRKSDPYNEHFGPEYNIILTSGCVHECFDYVKSSSSSVLRGRPVLKHSDLCEMLGLPENLASL
jgi:hypothetical protein